MTQFADHPHTDPGDKRTECDVCGKWVFRAIHSCKGVPVTEAAWDRHRARVTAAAAGGGLMPTPDLQLRWIIRKGRPGPFTNPDRPWQLWLSVGDLMGLKAERSSHAFCVQVMNRLTEEAQP